MGNTRFSLDTHHKQPIYGYLVYVSKSTFGMDWHSTPHTHYFTELFYITHGTGSFLVEGKSFDVAQDDLIIINPNIEHTEMSSGNSFSYIVLGIEGICLSSVPTLSNQSQAEYTLFHFSNLRNELLFYLNKLLEESEKKEDGYSTICQSILQILMTTMSRQIEGSLLIVPTVRISRESGFLKRYIDENYAQAITLDYLARLTHMNKYYLAHTFHKYTGQSPINYLNAKRIEESCNLLRTTNLSISQITGAIGFTSQSYFAQCFKKHMGETPNAYRKRSRSEKNNNEKGL